MAALFACAENEQAFEHADWGHGAFTRALLDECTDASRVTAASLSDSLYNRVSRMVKDKTNGDERQTVNGIVNGYVDLRLLPSDLTNSIGMTLKLIPAGEFLMGSNETRGDLETAGFVLGDSFDNSNEHPQHKVLITKPFYVGLHEVTRGEFAAFVKDTNYQTEAEKDGKGGWGCNSETTISEQKPEFNWRNTEFSQTDSHPVVNVTWNDAIAFCEWLSVKEGKKYRLPTEAEWEYTCTAGTSTRFFTGDVPARLAGYGNMQDTSFEAKFPTVDLAKHPSVPFNDGWGFTSPAGRFKPNPFGLHDMHGNVWEWCSDWYGSEYYASSPESDPQGISSGSRRVLRGGSWHNAASLCRSALRIHLDPSSRFNSLGFRLVLSPSGQ